SMLNAYAVLGVSRDAADHDVKTAFRRLAKKRHPDQCKAPDAEARFRELKTAYDMLLDPQRRRHLDLYLREQDNHTQSSAPDPVPRPAATPRTYTARAMTSAKASKTGGGAFGWVMFGVAADALVDEARKA